MQSSKSKLTPPTPCSIPSDTSQDKSKVLKPGITYKEILRSSQYIYKINSNNDTLIRTKYHLDNTNKSDIVEEPVHFICADNSQISSIVLQKATKICGKTSKIDETTYEIIAFSTNNKTTGYILIPFSKNRQSQKPVLFFIRKEK